MGLTTDELDELRRGGSLVAKLSEVGIAADVILMWGVSERVIIDELARQGIQVPS